MNRLSMAAAAALMTSAASASPAAPPDVGSAYGVDGAARWFVNPRSLPGGGSALQFTDITDGTVRILREDADWYVAGPSLTSFDPVTLRIRFLPGAIRMCGAASNDCTMVPQIPLRQEEVRFNSRGVELNGTIWLPAAVGRYPAVALAQGSEDTDRHGMDPLPQALASRGFAVLAYDKRGTGQSAGNWEDQGIEDLAADLKTAFRSVLLGHSEVRPNAAGVIGFSEGPWVAIEAQRKGAGFRYFVAISGGASTKGVSFLDKEAAKLREQGLSGPEFELAMRPHRETIAAATGRARTGGAASGFDRRIAYDPTQAWRSLTEPFLWIAGEWDVLQDQVAAADWLRDVVSMSTNPNHAIVVFPRANHALFDAPSPKPSDWQRMSAIERYAPGYWPLLLQWLGDHAPAPCPLQEPG